MSRGRTSFRLIPCPAYDVAGMERWLSDMAAEGLLLKQDGLFCGTAVFDRGAPRRVRYRLEAAQKSTSMWADDGGEPDSEHVALNEAYAWEYVARRAGFYVYRTFDPCARELHTDPEIKALTLNAVKKQRLETLISGLLWLLTYPLLVIRFGLLRQMLYIGTGTVLLAVGLVIWYLADSAGAFISLSRLQARIRRGELPFPHRPRGWRYWGKQGAKIALTALFFCLMLAHWSDSITDAHRTPLTEDRAPLPFATMRELSGSKAERYHLTDMGDSARFNYVRRWSDLLSPCSINYGEHGEVLFADGTELDGGYYVTCHELPSEGLARVLMAEFLRLARWEKNYDPLPAPETKADALVCYRDRVHFPTVLFRKGNVVVEAALYQTGSGKTLPLEEWVTQLVNSVS